MTTITPTELTTLFGTPAADTTAARPGLVRRARAAAARLGDSVVRAYAPPADTPDEALRYWIVTY